MKILLYTFDMVSGVERLMPWRTLLEVAKHVQDCHQVAICSAEGKIGEREYESVTIHTIEYGVEALKDFIQRGEWDVVYYPITYRQGLKDMSHLSAISVRKIAYVPGGLCPLSGSLKLIAMGVAKRALPYLLDTITPHSWIAKQLQKAGFEAIICQAPLTTMDAIKSGWRKAVTALPGRDSMEERQDDSKLNALGLQSEKFLLFSGAPASTRGAVMAIKAFDAIAESLPNVKMVMLMRRDIQSNFTAFERAVAEIKHRDRFVICYDQLSREQLFCFFRRAWAVLLPFVIIPSEIPLTFFEVMSQGTPVVTFENGGTTDYLRKGVKLAKHRTVASLSEAILSICTDASERNILANNALTIMNQHPSWKNTSEQWLSVL